MAVGIVPKSWPGCEPEIVASDCAGVRLTVAEFEAADFDDGWAYELMNGVLVVSPIPGEVD